MRQLPLSAASHDPGRPKSSCIILGSVSAMRHPVSWCPGRTPSRLDAKFKLEDLRTRNVCQFTISHPSVSQLDRPPLLFIPKPTQAHSKRRLPRPSRRAGLRGPHIHECTPGDALRVNERASGVHLTITTFNEEIAWVDLEFWGLRNSFQLWH